MHNSNSEYSPLDPKSSDSNCFPRIYFARAIDGQEVGVISILTLMVSDELAAVGMRLVDPTVNEPQPSESLDSFTIDHYRAIVDHDLRVLKTCDAILIDMSIADRSYIGCICEMTYAYLWKIPCAVYIGLQDDRRPWLHYHAAVFEQRKDAIAYLSKKIGR